MKFQNVALAVLLVLAGVVLTLVLTDRPRQDASLDGLLGSRAFGQVAGFTQDFIAVTGRMASGTDGVYVIDTKNMVVVVLYYDSSKGKLLFGDVQSLRNTFGRVR